MQPPCLKYPQLNPHPGYHKMLWRWPKFYWCNQNLEDPLVPLLKSLYYNHVAAKLLLNFSLVMIDDRFNRASFELNVSTFLLVAYSYH